MGNLRQYRPIRALLAFLLAAFLSTSAILPVAAQAFTPDKHSCCKGGVKSCCKKSGSAGVRISGTDCASNCGLVTQAPASTSIFISETARAIAPAVLSTPSNSVGTVTHATRIRQHNLRQRPPPFLFC